LRFGGLPIPDGLLKELAPKKLPKQPIVILRPTRANNTLKPEAQPASANNPSVSEPVAPNISATTAMKLWVPKAMQDHPQLPNERIRAWARRLCRHVYGSEDQFLSVKNEIHRIRKEKREGSSIKNAANSIK
jgi:hypothetical protein